MFGTFAWWNCSKPSKWCVGRPAARVARNKAAFGEVGRPASTSVSVYQVSNTGHPCEPEVMEVIPCHSAHPCWRMEDWSLLLTQPSTVDSVTGKLPGEVAGWLGKFMGCGASGGLAGGAPAAWTEAAGKNEKIKTISSTSVPPQIAEVLCFLLIQTFSPKNICELLHGPAMHAEACQDGLCRS